MASFYSIIWSAQVRLKQVFGIHKSYLFARMDTAMERAVVFPVIATLVGSWVGAFAIALDWDRPWQVGVFFCWKSVY